MYLSFNVADIFHLLNRFGNSMKTIFWSLFGEIDESGFQIDEEGYGAIWKTGMVLFGAFNIVAVLVALNMLIAILNESYTRISVRALVSIMFSNVLAPVFSCLKKPKATNILLT